MPVKFFNPLFFLCAYFMLFSVDAFAANIEAVAGRITLKNTSTDPEFTYVCFDTAFSETPLIFSLPTTASENDRLTLRVRNVTANGFEIAQVESPEDNNPNPPTGNPSQTVNFLAIVKGDYTLDDGSKMRVNSLATKKFQGKKLNNSSGNKGWETVSTADLGFSQPPAIIAAIQTMTNEPNSQNSSGPFPISDPFLATTITGVNNKKFKIALERGETNQGTINNDEIIGYIALTPGLTGQLTPDIGYESFRTPKNIKGVGSCSTFALSESNGSNNLHVIASQNTRVGIDGGWLKQCSIGNQRVGFSIVEDMDLDPEGRHTHEIAGGLALRGNVTDFTNSCGVAVDHYQIIHDGNGLTCEPETVTVKACTNGYDGTCTESLSRVSLTLKATGKGGTVVNSMTTNFTGSTNISVPYTINESTELTLANVSVTPINSLVCHNTGRNSAANSNTVDCSLVFNNAGFRFLSGNTSLPDPIIANQIAGSTFNDSLILQAVENNNGVCKGLFDGNINVGLAQQNIMPGANSPGLSFQINTPTPISIEKFAVPSPKYSVVTLNFDANGMATIPDPSYNDAGLIRLHANYTDGSINLSGSSNAFWVKPAKLAVIATKQGSELTLLNANTAHGSPTHKAGENFTLKVTAFNDASLVTPNYTPGQIQFELERTGPKSTTGVDGDFTYNSVNNHDNILTSKTAASVTSENVTLAKFSAGISTYTKAKYSEVGLLKLDVRDSAYGDGTMKIEADSINIGRFTPAYFTQKVEQEGALTASCSEQGTPYKFFAYSGQRDPANANRGTISYFIKPVMEITAHNAQGGITQNYFQETQGNSNDFMKLGAAGVTITQPSEDQKTEGVNQKKLQLTSHMQEGTLIQHDLGVLHYTLSNKDRFFYNRSGDTLRGPFEAQINISVSNIEDDDLITISSDPALNPKQDVLLSGIDIKFGRLVLEHSFGPETSNLAQPMQLQHYNGTSFINSRTNNCVSYDATHMTLRNISLEPSLTEVLGGIGPFISGYTQQLSLKAPGIVLGKLNQGNLGVTYNSDEWLKFDWNNNGNYDDNPYAVASFGLFRGNDRIIHWHEVAD